MWTIEWGKSDKRTIYFTIMDWLLVLNKKRKQFLYPFCFALSSHPNKYLLFLFCFILLTRWNYSSIFFLLRSIFFLFSLSLKMNFFFFCCYYILNIHLLLPDEKSLNLKNMLTGMIFTALKVRKGRKAIKYCRVQVTKYCFPTF